MFTINSQTTKSPSVAVTTWSMTHILPVSEIIMNKKPIRFNPNITGALFLGILGTLSLGAMAFDSSKPVSFQAESIQDQPQINIAAQSYQVENAVCHQYCTAKVKAGEYDIYVDYQLDDGSVEFLDILNVVHFDKTINAYIDLYEIKKINAAIAGGGK
ncbi:hypothetical protein [Acinetobacter sp. YH16038]|uniref:hypothetical protein n=1 Tax=Acinetobacter sp. YH16038 TaxID=2601183 RepID=UPI00211ECCC4|nr:hypothetical protein [Acinetobacter sp. YH16038]